MCDEGDEGEPEECDESQSESELVDGDAAMLSGVIGLADESPKKVQTPSKKRGRV